MALAPGTRLGAYEILTLIGSGGMGEVYRATDTKLGRAVALKILPASFTNDPERVARFRREAQVLASLNHPHIAQIHGMEEANGTQFLVLELVDGESLEKRITRGPIPVDDALGIAKQIAEALEAAHERGIIHRDLKPANIALTNEGTVKVLDFGLAKAVESATNTPFELANSPTITSPAMMTGIGVILGTAAYMAPEQAKGRPADKRSDIWAFGCVLYEMLTGKRAFEGDDVSDTLANVLKVEPDLSGLPTEVPAHVRTILKRCLEKDRKARIPEIAAVRFLLDDAVSSPSTSGTISPVYVIGERPPAWRRLAVYSLPALVLGGVAVLSILSFRSTPTPPLMRFEVQAPADSIFDVGPGLQAEISPNGRYIAFVATVAGRRPELFIRAIDELEARAVAVAGNGRPIWSPDSRFVAFGSEEQLKSVDVTGGLPRPICKIPRGAVFGAWGRDAILFSSPVTNGVLRVGPDGGTPTQLTTPGPDEVWHAALGFLPDGKHYLLGVLGKAGGSAVYVASLDSQQRTRLLSTFAKVEFALPDRLLFARDRSLFVQTLNMSTFALEGEASRILESVNTGPAGTAGFSVSQNGLLLLAEGRSGGDAELTWFDRSGKVLGQVGSAPFQGIDLSPDGKRVAVHTHADGAAGGDISIIDLERNNSTTRLTFDESQDNASPIWSPDGTSIAFSAIRNNRYGIYRKPSNGVGAEELLFESETPKVPSSWAPDGKSIVLIDYDPKTLGDLWILPLVGDRKPTLYLQSPDLDIHAQISPDGHWVAYTSGASVWVQSYPVPGTKYRVSAENVVLPRWRRDGRELFFSSRAAGRIWSVSVSPNGPGLTLGTPQLLFDRRFFSLPHGTASRSTNYHTYAVSADGQRFLAPRQPAVDASNRSLTVVVNWSALLKN